MIDRIKELNAQTITLEKKATVQSIRTAYNALSDTEKAQVSNYNLLVQAEATIAQLEAQKNNANTNNPLRVIPVLHRPELRYIMRPISTQVRISIWTA